MGLGASWDPSWGGGIWQPFEPKMALNVLFSKVLGRAGDPSEFVGPSSVMVILTRFGITGGGDTSLLGY